MFLSSGKTSKTSSEISFIDLDYFGRALGKTTLPIFKMPLDFDVEQMRVENIENPAKLIANSKGLQIGNLNLKLEQNIILKTFYSFKIHLGLLQK